MRQLTLLQSMIVCAIAIALSAANTYAQVFIDKFESFDPIQIKDVDDRGKAYIDYEDIWLIEKNEGRWIIPEYYGKDMYVNYPDQPDADNYVTRGDGVERGRAIVYVFNNTKRKVKTLEGVGFDYFNKRIEGVEKNISYRIWGVEDPEKDGWNNRYLIGFGGKEKFADNNVVKWTDEDDLNFTSIVYRDDIQPSNEWKTYSLSKNFDVSNYDWIFICFGHAFQLKQDGALNELFGIDNVVIPGSSKK